MNELLRLYSFYKTFCKIFTFWIHIAVSEKIKSFQKIITCMNGLFPPPGYLPDWVQKRVKAASQSSWNSCFVLCWEKMILSLFMRLCGGNKAHCAHSHSTDMCQENRFDRFIAAMECISLCNRIIVVSFTGGVLTILPMLRTLFYYRFLLTVWKWSHILDMVTFHWATSFWAAWWATCAGCLYLSL